MGGNTALILMNIFFIGLIAIIIVKLYYREEKPEINNNKTIAEKKSSNRIIPLNKEKSTDSFISNYFNRQNENYDKKSLRKKGSVPKDNFNHSLIPRKSKEKQINKINNENQLTNLQESKKIYRGDNMSKKNNDTVENLEFGKNVNVDKDEKKGINKLAKKETDTRLENNDQSTQKETYTEIVDDKQDKPKTGNHDLKDLFTIDELIKESKRKDSERENEANKIKQKAKEIKENNNQEKAEHLTSTQREEIKDRVKSIESAFEEEKKEEEKEEAVKKVEESTIADVINESEEKIGTPILKTPTKVEKSIDDVIKDTVKEKIEETPTERDQSTQKSTYTEIKEAQPVTKDQPVNDDLFKEESEVTFEDENNYSSDDDFGVSLDESELFTDIGEDDFNLDYRKDLAKLTNKVKNSKIFSEVKNKLIPEEDNEFDPDMNEEFLRNVRNYDAPQFQEEDFPEYEPIYNETFEKYQAPEPKPIIEEIKEEKEKIKSAPTRENITIKINNNNEVLHKGDEIIFNHEGDSYSSKVYDIIGDDISVRFRGNNITIKPEDVKKIF